MIRTLSTALAAILLHVSMLVPAAMAGSVVLKPMEGDFIAPDFRFGTGEKMAELKLHYTTLGEPKRDAAGHVTNAVMILHGTGGDERSLLELGRAAAPGFALISPRGRVLEDGQARFFKRFAEGVLDEDDLRFRARELSDFVLAICAQNGLRAPIAIGFSNGANIAAAMLLLAPHAIAGAALLRPMQPFQSMPTAQLGGKSVLIVSGAADQLSSEETNERLAAHYGGGGAAVCHRRLAAGHSLSESDAIEVANWLTTLP